MRKSFKWLLSLVPVTAGSIGTAVYLTSENRVESLREINPEQKKVRVETRVSPLSSSQNNKEILKTDNLDGKKSAEKEAEKPQKVIVPTNSEVPKATNELKEPEKPASAPLVIAKKQLPSVPKVEKKPEVSPKILVAPPSQEKQVDLKPETKKTPEKVSKTPAEVAVVAQKPEKIQPQSDKNPKEIKKVVLVEPSTTDLKNKKEEKQEKTLIPPVLGNVEVKKEEKVPEKPSIPAVVQQESPKTQEENKAPEPEKEAKKAPNSVENKPETQVLDQKSSGDSKSETNEQVVGNIVSKLVEDLKDLTKLRKSVYEYKFTKNEQMALFLQKFPKTPITEQQAYYLGNFWENNYAHFYPSYAASKSVRDQWRKELRKALVIEPEPEIGPFSRISGGHVFIFDGKNNNDWVSATPSGGSDVP